MNSKLFKLAIAGILLTVSELYIPPIAHSQSVIACNIGSLPPQAANYKLRGSRLLRLNNNEEALDCFRQALRDDRATKDPQVWNGLGVALARLRRFDDAIAAYDRAIGIRDGVVVDRINRLGNSNRLQPQDYYIFWFNKGTALGDLGKTEDALVSINKAISLNGSYGPAWFYRGVYLRRLGRNSEASNAYTKATAFAPQLSYNLLYREQIAQDDFLFWQGQGIGYTRIGRYKDARVAFNRSNQIIQANPNIAVANQESYAFYYEGVRFLDEGNPEMALNAFDKSIQVKPDFAEGWHAKGNVYSSLGKYREAIAAYDQALKYDSNLHNSWFERGIAYTRLKQPQMALSSYRKATDIASDFAEAWHNSGRILYDLNRYPEALEAFNMAIAGEALRGGVEPYESLFGKSVTLYAMKRYPEARTAVNETLKLNPNFKSAIALRNQLR
ncbi:tetratricopeptide repeat protein [Synechococcus sp. PCC 7502]|uniref:tetratricopeptide repeat protein n=1 Tax=Synechococcus sp. PCC 7502 TaxID=1173263 RepID=UPI00029FF0D6|nr:tetratricopeptide repeat protein [Synechococcus sp. PCC 7502]AFY73359.1 tetratricopeptide repeat protein [Synechococcus sp. PCC 7502]